MTDLTDETVERYDEFADDLDNETLVTVEDCAATETRTQQRFKYVKIRIGDAEARLLQGRALELAQIVGNYASLAAEASPRSGEAAQS
jgi:hypothetical protein